MKLRLCWEIFKNLAWLLSWDFLKAAREDWAHAKLFAMLILYTAANDILRMIFVPGYPNKAAP